MESGPINLNAFQPKTTQRVQSGLTFIPAVLQRGEDGDAAGFGGGRMLTDHRSQRLAGTDFEQHAVGLGSQHLADAVRKPDGPPQMSRPITRIGGFGIRDPAAG